MRRERNIIYFSYVMADIRFSRKFTSVEGGAYANYPQTILIDNIRRVIYGEIEPHLPYVKKSWKISPKVRYHARGIAHFFPGE